MKLNLYTLLLLLTIIFMSACIDKEHKEVRENKTADYQVQKHPNEDTEIKRDLYIDREHRKELQAAIRSDEEGKLLLPAIQMMGKESDFHRTFKDDFKRVGPWVEEKTRVSDLHITKGNYYIENKDAENAYFVFVPLAVDGKFNWAIESKLSMRRLPDSSKYGLTFGMDEESGSKHVFYIDCNNKLLSIASYEHDSIKILIEDKACKAIEAIDNVLRIESIDEFWYYYVNENLVYCEAARELYKDKFGLGIDGAGSMTSDYFLIQW